MAAVIAALTSTGRAQGATGFPNRLAQVEGTRRTTVGLGDAIRRQAERRPAIAVLPQASPEHRRHGWIALAYRTP